MKINIITFLSLLLLASCTHIVATNFPGKPKGQIPEKWAGTYNIKFPGFLSMVDPTEKSSTVTITRDMIEWNDSGKVSKYSLKDSLRLTTLGKDFYISMHNSHGQYTVFKVKEVEDGLNLYGLTAESEIEGDELKPFFKDVREHQLDSGNNDAGIRLYEVTIDDSKLDAYFESDIPAG